MKNLITILDYYLKACQRATDLPTKRTFFDQAFGACQYHIFIFSYEQNEVQELWDTYKAQFEKNIYGV
jgi:hypothetical protein